MTPAEFKAWLEGFSEAIDGRPTAAQWERIKEQVKKLTAPLQIDVARPLPALPNYPTWSGQRLVQPGAVPNEPLRIYPPSYPTTCSVGGCADTSIMMHN